MFIFARSFQALLALALVLNKHIIVEERKTNLISIAILFHFLYSQHVSDINISIIRSLRLC